jgi:Protein of unknown function (DUF3995)
MEASGGFDLQLKERLMIQNIHERRFGGIDVEQRVGALLDTLSSPADKLWPSDTWPPLRLDRGLVTGSSGGHGPIGYHVESYEPGKSVVFRFAAGLGIVGTHRLDVVADRDGSTVVRHTLEGELEGPMRMGWPLMVRWLHDALIEDALDNVEASLAQERVPPTRKHSFVVRRLRSAMAATQKRSSAAERAAGNAVTIALLAAAALHGAWGFGLRWPGTDSVSLANKVVGGSTFPSSIDCFAVTGLLTFGAAMISARTRLQSPPGKNLPAPLIDIGVMAMATVIAVRGAGGMIGSATNLLTTTEEFRRLNLVMYSPLCLAIAGGSLFATGRPRTRSASGRPTGGGSSRYLGT